MQRFLDKNEIDTHMPKSVLEHCKSLLKDSNLPQSEDSLDKVIENWLFKKAVFNKLQDHWDLSRAEELSADNVNAFLALTLSGSILGMGPAVLGQRELFYSSLKMRTDVPQVVHATDAVITGEIALNQSIYFSKGPIRQTSPIIDIGVIQDEPDLNRQLKKIKNVNDLLLDDFIEVQKTVMDSGEEDLENRNDLFHQWIIIQWFIIGGFEKQIFLARAKMLWLELFTDVYVSLLDQDNRDSEFLNFSNKIFSDYIDKYKWLESERKDFDIGLMKALEEVPENEEYIQLVRKFIHPDGGKIG
jgi:hypothetical protein